MTSRRVPPKTEPSTTAPIHHHGKLSHAKASAALTVPTIDAGATAPLHHGGIARAAEDMTAPRHYKMTPPVGQNIRAVVPGGSGSPSEVPSQAVVCAGNYVASPTDTLIDVVESGVVITLPQNPIQGSAPLVLVAEAACTLTAGAFGPPLTPSDPLSISAGSVVVAARGAEGWVVTALGGGGGAGTTGATGPSGASGSAGATGATGASGGGGGGGATPISVINTGPIPTAGATAAPYNVELGGDGMPAPDSFTTETGHVKVTVVVGFSGAELEDYTIQGIRDGSVLFGVTALALAVSGSTTFVGLDTVTAGTAHTWGVQLVSVGEANASQVQPHNAVVIVEDVNP